MTVFLHSHFLFLQYSFIISSVEFCQKHLYEVIWKALTILYFEIIIQFNDWTIIQMFNYYIKRIYIGQVYIKERKWKMKNTTNSKTLFFEDEDYNENIEDEEDLEFEDDEEYQ